MEGAEAMRASPRTAPNTASVASTASALRIGSRVVQRAFTFCISRSFRGREAFPATGTLGQADLTIG